MKTTLAFLILSLTVSTTAFSQDKFFTKTGKIVFDASGNMETVAATNKLVTAVVDSKTGALQFAVQMKGFEFAKALMQEHFNEDYVESTKFPRAEFKGQIENSSAVNFTQDGTSNVKVSGKMTLHGVTKNINSAGKITVRGGKPILNADFSITLADYNMSIPNLVKDKIAPVAKVSVDCALEPLK